MKLTELLNRRLNPPIRIGTRVETRFGLGTVIQRYELLDGTPRWEVKLDDPERFSFDHTPWFFRRDLNRS